MAPIFGLELGQVVELWRPHPHHGKTGTVESFDRLAGLGMTGAKVRFEDGRCCYITRPDHFRKPRKKTPPKAKE